MSTACGYTETDVLEMRRARRDDRRLFDAEPGLSRYTRGLEPGELAVLGWPAGEVVVRRVPDGRLIWTEREQAVST